jgi:hypothetical protein
VILYFGYTVHTHRSNSSEWIAHDRLDSSHPRPRGELTWHARRGESASATRTSTTDLYIFIIHAATFLTLPLAHRLISISGVVRVCAMVRARHVIGRCS